MIASAGHPASPAGHRYSRNVAAVSASDVATELRRRLPGLPTKKLHKLLYYCQGHHVATFDEALFVETVSAWDMGPVVGQLWKAESSDVSSPEAPHDALTEAQLNTIGYVVSRYGALSGRDLETLSHNEAPWRDANLRRRPGTSERISVESMREFFRAESDDDGDGVVPDNDAVSEWLGEVAGPPVDAAVPDSVANLKSRLGRG
jgi:uncharacterized phage-associated protein